jgi:hypothetical protein
MIRPATYPCQSPKYFCYSVEKGKLLFTLKRPIEYSPEDTVNDMLLGDVIFGLKRRCQPATSSQAISFFKFGKQTLRSQQGLKLNARLI